MNLSPGLEASKTQLDRFTCGSRGQATKMDRTTRGGESRSRIAGIFLAIVVLVASAATVSAEIAANWKKAAPYGDLSATISNKALSANVVTITTAAPHGFKIGEQVQVLCSPADSVIDTSPYTGYTITTVPSATTFTYARTAGNIASQASGGTAKRLVLTLNSGNIGMCYNPSTGHVLVSRGNAVATAAPTNNVGIHIFNFDGTDVGEMSMGPTIVNKALATNVVTLTTLNPHGLTTGQQVVVAMDTPDPVFDTANAATITITGTPSSTTFTYAKTNADVPSVAATGKVKIIAGGSSTYFEKVRADQGGGIYGCNEVLGAFGTSTDILTVYYWASESADPIIIFRNNASDTATLPTYNVGPRLPAAQGPVNGGTGLRVGAAFDAVADGTGGAANVELYFLKAIQGSAGVDRFYKMTFNKASSVVSAVTQTSLVGGFSAGGNLNPGSIHVDGFGGQIYISTASTNAELSRYENDGTGRVPAVNFKSYTVSNKALATNVATITTTANHEFAVGQVIAVRTGDAAFDGSYNVVAVPSTTTFTYAKNGADVASAVASGTVNGPALDNVPHGGAFNSGPQGASSTGGGNGRPVNFGGKKYYVGFEYMSHGHPDVNVQWNSAMVTDITSGLNNARYVDNTEGSDVTAATTTASNGDIAIDDQTARPGRFFIMAKNGQLGSYTIPTLAAPSTKTWSGGGDGQRWFDAANWSPAGVPNAANDVVLNHSTVGGAYTVRIASLKAAACRTLTIDAGNAAKIAVRVSAEGEACGTPFQTAGTGLSDLTVSGTFRWPLNKDESMKPRYRVQVFKGTNAISTLARTANVATVVTSLANNLAVGNSVVVNSSNAAFNGTFVITAVGTNSVSYANAGADQAATAATGTTSISGPDQFTWGNTGAVVAAGGVGVFEQNGNTVGVAMTGAAQTLSDGYSATFAATTGHMTGDAWLFNPLYSDTALYIAGDGTAANDLIVQNGGYLENYFNGRFSGAPDIFNVYGSGNTCLIGAGGTLVHGTGLASSYGRAWQSDRVSEYFTNYDGKLTYAPTATCVVDIFGTNVATQTLNYPSLTRSYDYANVVTANSWPTIQTSALYSNTVNPTNFKCDNLTVNANTALTIQTNQATGLTATRKQLTANVATLTFVSQNAQPGDVVVVALTPADAAFDGARVVTASTLTSISFASNAADVPYSLTAGTSTKQTGYQIRINGNLTNNGTGAVSLDGQSATGRGVTFGGTSTLAASGGTYAFPQAFNVKSGSSLTLGTDITVPSAKTALIDGVVNTGANKVQAGTAAGLVGTINAASAGVINGTLKQWVGATVTTYTLPIGTASTSETAVLAFTAAPGTGGSITATFVGGAPVTTGLPLVDTDAQNLGLMNSIGYWSLVSGDALAGGTYNLSVTANGATPAATTSKMRIVKRPAAGSWAIDGTPGTNAFPLIARTGMSGFSEFGIAQPDPAGVADFMLY